MTNIFVYSDPHFGHQATCTTFKKADGSDLRPWNVAQDMNEALIENHNKVVGPKDKVYILGDLSMRKTHLHHLGRLNGDKVLIRGNHEMENYKEYAKYFRDIRSYHQLDKCILSHIPIHPQSMYRWKVNVHGHLHSEEVLSEDGRPDKRYICVSLEQPWMNFHPIAWEDLMKVVEARSS